MPYTVADIPDQSGKLAIITGATGGLGYETALALAGAKMRVILAGRNPQKGTEALVAIRAVHPKADIRFELLDLASLSSAAAFAERILTAEPRLDLLINNAGVMMPPTRQVTADGLELQFETNYLSHFALTLRLLPALRAAHGRVVPLASIAARDAALNFADLQFVDGYAPMRAYGQTKLACLMFGFELQRRSDAAGIGITSVVAHPGIARTELVHNGIGRASAAGVARNLLWFMFQPAAQGALPTLYAATSAGAKPGGYYGPDGWMEARGLPGTAAIPKRALDGAAAQRLWDVSEQLTGLSFPALDSAA